MRHHVQLAVTLQIVAAVCEYAQVQSEAPTQLHAPQLGIHRHHASDDLSWITRYADPAPDGRESQLVNDPKFLPLLKSYFTAPQSFWNKGESLPDVARELLGVPGQVFTEENRYVAATGCAPQFCADRGLLWVDTGAAQPLLVFAAIDWVSDNRVPDQPGAAYTLRLFPSRALGAAHLPAGLVHSVARWTAQPYSGAKNLQDITRVYLVDPDGTPHTLAPATVGAHNTLPAETNDEQKAQS